MAYFHHCGGLEQYLSKKDILVSFIATYIHDFEHPGVTNQFIIRSKHPKAIRYNDNSPLENHHCSAAFSIMFNPKWNFLCDFNKEDLREMRLIIINMILKTDIALHLQEYQNLRIKITSANETTWSSFEDKSILMVSSLKACDLAKPCRPWKNYMNWMSYMQEEFYSQGDMEKMLGIQITPNFMDRQNP